MIAFVALAILIGSIFIASGIEAGLKAIAAAIDKRNGG